MNNAYINGYLEGYLEKRAEPVDDNPIPKHVRGTLLGIVAREPDVEITNEGFVNAAAKNLASRLRAENDPNGAAPGELKHSFFPRLAQAEAQGLVKSKDWTNQEANLYTTLREYDKQRRHDSPEQSMKNLKELGVSTEESLQRLKDMIRKGQIMAGAAGRMRPTA